MGRVILQLMVVARQWGRFLLSEVLDFVEAFLTGTAVEETL